MKIVFAFLLLTASSSMVFGQTIPVYKKIEKRESKSTNPNGTSTKNTIINREKPVSKSQRTKKGIIEPEMVFIQGGSFNMGSNTLHKVTVNSFKMSKYEITQAEWKAIVKTNPSQFNDCNQCPVENVSYTDVLDFIEELNYKTGKEYRLPTEAEWEFAARGGIKSNDYDYSGSSVASKVAWTSENSESKTHPVGQLRCNELGLYDMSGNVWEWCNDWYNSEYYSNSVGTNPKGPESGLYRVRRGGSWLGGATGCRVTTRDFGIPNGHHGGLGFRLVHPVRLD